MSAQSVTASLSRASSLGRGAVAKWGAENLDRILAATLLIWGLAAVSIDPRRHGPLGFNAAVVVGLAGAMLVRRRWPLVFVAVSYALALVTTIWLTNVTKSTWTLYLLLVPPYTAAAYEELPRASVGLAAAIVVPAIVDTMASHVLSNLVFTTIMVTISWTTGRAMRHRRMLAFELEQRASRVAAEREDRARLAVADERSRIARELHAVVANSVSAMVVQSETAQRQLLQGSPEADATMAAIEAAGREALGEMRRILGVLRRSDDGPAPPTLAPQPGVGQLAALAERERARGADVELHVEGEPGPLPVAVDLAVYRILEEALQNAGVGAGPALDVTLRFGETDVELEVVGDGAGFTSWPTIGMRERVALCEGTLTVEPAPSGGVRLLAELPRTFDEVFA